MFRRCAFLLGLSLVSCSPAPPIHTEPAPTQPVSAAPVAAPPPTLPATALDPGRGKEVGLTFQAYLSPWQEGGEEQDTPATVPAVFRSTTPSLTRAQREAAGHRGVGVVRFTNDLSRAFVDVKIEGVDLATVNMFHIHCGKPGILGPILVDFALGTDLKKSFQNGVFSIEITDDLIVKTSSHGHGAVDAFTMGCIIGGPSLSAGPPPKVSTVAGMAEIAMERQLYFNLHTTGQTYFGDIRGQIHPAKL
jgi:CHRD domain